MTTAPSLLQGLDEALEEINEQGLDSRRMPLVTWLRKWLLPIALVAAVWEVLAHVSGLNPQLFPPVEVVARTFWHLLLNGTLVSNAEQTLHRIAIGWAVASVVGVVGGFVMYRNAIVQDLVLPLISILLPIPSIALIPVFILWFGLGNSPIIVLVAFSALLPTMLNTWTGMRSINPVLVKAAQSMNVRGVTLFRKVVLPASLPGVMTGLRLGLAQAWRAAVAGEMIAGVTHGLGVTIFQAQQFVQTDVMLAALLVIGPLGMILEKVLFQTVERRTIEKWGMTRRA